MRAISLPTCCVTGRVAGDPLACGDCDPCIGGAALIPDVVKRLIQERDDWARKYEEVMTRDLRRKRSGPKKWEDKVLREFVLNRCEGGESYSEVARLTKLRFGIDLTRGMIAGAVHRHGGKDRKAA